jgi:hypothetical protein
MTELLRMMFFQSQHRPRLADGNGTVLGGGLYMQYNTHPTKIENQ